jgi:hypothetical protein
MLTIVFISLLFAKPTPPIATQSKPAEAIDLARPSG